MNYVGAMLCYSEDAEARIAELEKDKEDLLKRLQIALAEVDRLRKTYEPDKEYEDNIK